MIGRTQLAVVEHDEEFAEQTAEQRLTDEAEVRRIIDEIDNACDEKNWEKCRSFFTDEVKVDFTSLAGGEAGRISADQLIDGWKTNLYAEKKTFHQRGNHRIKIRGDRAEAFSKAYAFNLLETGEVTGFWEVWANYTHHLRRTEAGWECAGMILEVIFRRGDEKVRTFVPKS